MDNILEGVKSFIGSSTSGSLFKAIEYSENVEDMIKSNLLPFVDIVGIRERKSPISGFMFPDRGYRGEYDISIIISQDAKLTKDILHGKGTAPSIWSLWNSVWGVIAADKTFGGTVNRIADKTVESKLLMSKKEGGSIKLLLETELTVIKDVFK